jgi:hypothetical protein
MNSSPGYPDPPAALGPPSAGPIPSLIAPIGGVCPICGQPASRHKPLYDTLVCRECWFAFVNRRQGAFFLDFIIWAGLFALAPAIPLLGDASFWIFLILWMLFAFKDGFNGMSPGKWLLGIQTVNCKTLEPIGWGASCLRNLLLAVPFLGVPVAVYVAITL